MKKNKNYAFVDGSFNPDTKIYGCGVILIDQFGKRHIIQKRGSNPNFIPLRNVAGEILGATVAIKKALELGMKYLTIYYDYEGIANWPLGRWKTKKEYTKRYAKYIQKVMKGGLKIYFKHVKSHSGIHENEEVDRLAKEIVGIYKKKGVK